MTTDAGRALAVAAATTAGCVAVTALQPISFGVAGVFMLIVAALASLSPLGVLLAVIVSLPYFYMPLEIGSQQFAASELLLVGAGAGLLLRIAFDLATRRTTLESILATVENTARSRLFLFLLVITAAGALTIITAYDPTARDASLREWRWSLLFPLTFLAMLGVVGSSRIARMLLAAALVASGLIAAAHGLFDTVSGGGVLADNVRRLSGPFPHPNALALYLVRPLALGVALAALWPRLRIPLLVPVSVIGLVTFGTFSRGAMIALIALAVLVSLHVPARVRLVLAGSVATFGGLALLVAGDRMRSALEGGSVSLRLDIWTSAIHMIRDRPLLGYGPDQFLYAYSPRYILPTAWDERFTSHAHNLIADSWIRLGFIGAVAAVVALVYVFQRAWHAHQMRTGQDILGVAALVALAAALVHGLIDNAYFAHDLAMSGWLLAWLAFTRVTEDEDQLYDP